MALGKMYFYRFDFFEINVFITIIINLFQWRKNEDQGFLDFVSRSASNLYEYLKKKVVEPYR